jgi:general secretion pathway protein L
MLSEADLRPAVLTPATLAVPVAVGEWTLVITEEGFLARHGDWRVFAGETANLDHYLRAETSLAAEAEAGTIVEVLNCSGQEFSLQLDWLNLSPARPAQIMAVLAAGFADGPSINLLQGEFSDNAHWLETCRRWQVALAAAAVLFFLIGVDTTLDYSRLRSESTRLNREITTTFQQAFPDSHRVVNARAQMEQKLKELRANNRRNNFFVLYDKVAPLLATTDSPAVEFIRFHEGRLELDLNLASVAVLEKLKDNLAKAPGITAEIGNAENTGGRVRAHLTLEVKS